MLIAKAIQISIHNTDFYEEIRKKYLEFHQKYTLSGLLPTVCLSHSTHNHTIHAVTSLESTSEVDKSTSTRSHSTTYPSSNLASVSMTGNINRVRPVARLEHAPCHVSTCDMKCLPASSVATSDYVSQQVNTTELASDPLFTGDYSGHVDSFPLLNVLKLHLPDR